MFYLTIINTLILLVILYKEFNINFIIPKRITEEREEITENDIVIPDNVMRFKERIKGINVDVDGLYDSPPPPVTTEFTGVEIITPSMEIKNDRRY